MGSRVLNKKMSKKALYGAYQQVENLKELRRLYYAIFKSINIWHIISTH